MCRIDTGLARKADIWCSGCTKRVMFQKHTGTAILLRCLELITVHEGAMSIVHYRTLGLSHFLESFICHEINMYDTRDPTLRVLGLVLHCGEKGGSSKSAPPLLPLPHLHRVASANSCMSSGNKSP